MTKNWPLKYLLPTAKYSCFCSENCLVYFALCCKLFRGRKIYYVYVNLHSYMPLMLDIAVHFQIVIYHLSTLLVVCSQLFMINSNHVRYSYRVTFIFKLIDSHFNVQSSILSTRILNLNIKIQICNAVSKKTIEIIRIINEIPIFIKWTSVYLSVELLIFSFQIQNADLYIRHLIYLFLLARHYSRLGWQDLHRPRFR